MCTGNTSTQAIKASEQPGLPSKAGILAQADRIVRSKAHTWLTELLPELEEKTAVSLTLPDCAILTWYS